MHNFQRIFGAGPRGLFLSLVLLGIAWKLKQYMDLPKIHGNSSLGLVIFISLTVLTMATVLWSLKSLTLEKRGEELVTTGAFKYFRHPLYAAFLTFFNFGLAILLDNYIYVIWPFYSTLYGI